MTDNLSAVETLAKCIVDSANQQARKAGFDRTRVGVVVSTDDLQCSVRVDGAEYTASVIGSPVVAGDAAVVLFAPDRQIFVLGVTGKPAHASSKKFIATLTGDGNTDTFAITHNLATTDVVVSVEDASLNAYASIFGGFCVDDGGVLYDKIVTSTAVDENTVNISFCIKPTNGSKYKVIILG